MIDVDLGINDASLKYEVALDALGGDLQPFLEAIRLEKEKAKPSAAAIAYFEMRIAAIDELQQELRQDDLDTINQIRDPYNRLFRLGRWVRYPVTVEPDGKFFLVTFVDVPEAITQGSTYAEALEMAKDVLESSQDFYREKGLPFPKPSGIKDGQSFIQILL